MMRMKRETLDMSERHAEAEDTCGSVDGREMINWNHWENWAATTDGNPRH